VLRPWTLIAGGRTAAPRTRERARRWVPVGLLISFGGCKGDGRQGGRGHWALVWDRE
jgi:hypothetical protein